MVSVWLAGMVAGLPADVSNGHHLVNRTDKSARYSETGTSSTYDEVHFSDVDLVEKTRDGKDRWYRRDGTPIL